MRDVRFRGAGFDSGDGLQGQVDPGAVFGREFQG